MATERDTLELMLSKKEKELLEVESICDDIVKTVYNHIRPIPPGFSYLDGINVGKFWIQAGQLRERLLQRGHLQQAVKELREALG